jgi:acetyl esterase/lipase
VFLRNTFRPLFLLGVLCVAGMRPASAQVPAKGQVILLWPEGVPGILPDAGPELLVDARVSNVHVPTLTAYPAPAGQAVSAAVIICPGGSYMRLAIEKEGDAVAEWLHSLGVSAFVLKYRLKEYGQPAPLRDVLRAIRVVRSQAGSWRVDPGKIGVMGFSAGGHLASSAATLFDAPEGKTGAALDAVSARPDFAVLVYPVISMEPPVAHAGSRENLLGPDPPPDLVRRWSTETQVTAATPPTFLLHGADDQSVPAENSVRFYQALRRAGVPAELHIYEHGPHGFALAPDVGPASGWPTRCAEWLAAHGIIAP